MFSGIIEELGQVADIKRSRKRGNGKADGGARLVIRRERARGVRGKSPAGSSLREGESVAVNGVCLTAKDIGASSFAADLSPETLQRSSLASLKPGARVNLERAMTANGRFSGHIVQGHVDGVGKLVSLEALADGNYWLTVEIPAELERYVVWKGSIALDGISLTVARLEDSRVGVAVIPHTYQNTNLCDLKPGATINLECDVLAKYVEKLLSTLQAPVGGSKPSQRRSSITMERLLEEGF